MAEYLGSPKDEDRLSSRWGIQELRGEGPMGQVQHWPGMGVGLPLKAGYSEA